MQDELDVPATLGNFAQLFGFILIGISLFVILSGGNTVPVEGGTRVANIQMMFQTLIFFLTGAFLTIYGRLLQIGNK